MSGWIDRATPIRKGEELQTEALERYLIERMPEVEGSMVIEQFPKGYSNLTYLLRVGERDMVLRRPPFGADIKTAHDMSREHRILSHLAKVFPKAPRPLLYCEDETILGAPFYIMERVRGVILRPQMPGEMIPAPSVMSGIAASMVDTLATLHDLDYRAAGLGQLGKPEGYVARQVEGWTNRYLHAKTDDIPQIEEVARRLAEKMPQESGSSLIHNDYKYDNIVLNSDNWEEILAILDWEMATIGDPLMDLGASLGYWINASDPGFMQKLKLSPTTLPGNPTREEVVERYARKSGRNVDNIVYYYAFGLFKIAVIIQQIYYRYKKGHTSDERFAGLIEGVRGCGVAALQAFQKGRLDNLF